MLGLSATAAREVSSIWPAPALGHKDGDGPVGQRGGWRWACRPEERLEMGLQARGGARCSPSCPLPLPSLGCELRPVVCHGPDSVIIMVLSGFKNL